MRRVSPPDVAPPLGRYSHGLITSAAAERLLISGQVGVRPDGSIAEGVEEQSRLAWRNIARILAEAGMEVEHLVRYTTYLVSAGDIAAYRSARDEVLGEHLPCSTLLVISALASPELLVEVEAEAVRDA